MVCIGVYGDVKEYMVLIRGIYGVVYSTMIIGMFRYIIIIIYEVPTNVVGCYRWPILNRCVSVRRRIGLATFHRKLSYSMGIDSAERFVFSFMDLNTQFRAKTQFTFRMKKVESSLLVRFSTEAFKIAHAR